MRIVLLCDCMTIKGGVERVVASWANYWISRGHQVTIITLLEQTPYENAFKVDQRVSQHHLGVPRVRSNSRIARALQIPRAAFRLYCLARERKPHYLISNGIGLSVISAALGLLIRGSKIVVCDHNNFDSFPIHWRALRHIVYRFADRAIVLTGSAIESYRRIGARPVHIPNPLGIVPSSRSSTSQKRILAIGRLTSQKGFDLLIRIWSKVSPTFPEWKLHIVGDGPEKESLVALVEHFEIEDSIAFFPSTTQIEQHYLSASIFVLTSRHEGLPVVLIEAQAFGLPIVAFDCPTGPREFITPGSGYLVPPGDIDQFSERLSTLMASEQERIAMSHRALLNVQNYSIENVMHRWNCTVFSNQSD